MSQHPRMKKKQFPCTLLDPEFCLDHAKKHVCLILNNFRYLSETLLNASLHRHL